MKNVFLLRPIPSGFPIRIAACRNRLLASGRVLTVEVIDAGLIITPRAEPTA
ncbi:MAG: hypothetical protein ABR923_12260 [Terracidiphilus sp.]|jgi:hypothetical protein